MMRIYPFSTKYKVLIILYRLGGSGKYTDIDRIMRNSDLRFFIEQLKLEGLITDEYMGNRHIIKLTEDGMRLASKLVETEEFVAQIGKRENQ